MGTELVELVAVGGDVVVGFTGLTCFAGGDFLPELFEGVFNNLAFSLVRVPI